MSRSRSASNVRSPPAARPRLTETELLPPERFPHLLALQDADDPEDIWAFSVETLVAGLHTQVRRAKRR